jgi:hypothetical protein
MGSGSLGSSMEKVSMIALAFFPQGVTIRPFFQIFTGNLELRNGDKYEGQFKNGLYHGEGKYTFSNGTKECGTWSVGRREGKFVITNVRWIICVCEFLSN